MRKNNGNRGWQMQMQRDDQLIGLIEAGGGLLIGPSPRVSSISRVERGETFRFVIRPRVLLPPVPLNPTKARDAAYESRIRTDQRNEKTSVHQHPNRLCSNEITCLPRFGRVSVIKSIKRIGVLGFRGWENFAWSKEILKIFLGGKSIWIPRIRIWKI